MNNMGISKIGVSTTRVGMTAETKSEFHETRWELKAVRNAENGGLAFEFRRASADNKSGGNKFVTSLLHPQWTTWAKQRHCMTGFRHLTEFANIAPADVSFDRANGVLVVTTPPKAELRRPMVRNVKKRSSAVSAIPSIPPLELTSSLNLSDVRLRDLIEELNRRKGDMGDALVLSVAAEGRLRATLEYGG